MENRPPKIDISFEELPEDPAKRHEVLVDVFGQYVFWGREWALNATKQLGESLEARERVAAIRRGKYDDLASMSTDDHEVAYEVAQATVDRFIQMFLTAMSGTGVDQRLGTRHAIRFRIDMEICDVDSHHVVACETINRGGKKFFADYWGRWLNRFRK